MLIKYLMKKIILFLLFKMEKRQPFDMVIFLKNTYLLQYAKFVKLNFFVHIEEI